MSAFAKNALMRASAATLPTKSSTTALIASWPPRRSNSDFSLVAGVVPPSVLLW